MAIARHTGSEEGNSIKVGEASGSEEVGDGVCGHDVGETSVVVVVEAAVVEAEGARVVMVVGAVVVEGVWVMVADTNKPLECGTDDEGGTGTTVVGVPEDEVDGAGAEGARVVVVEEGTEGAAVDEGTGKLSPACGLWGPAAKSPAPEASAEGSAVTSLAPNKLTATQANTPITKKVITQIPIESRFCELGSLCINGHLLENCSGAAIRAKSAAGGTRQG